MPSCGFDRRKAVPEKNSTGYGEVGRDDRKMVKYENL